MIPEWYLTGVHSLLHKCFDLFSSRLVALEQMLCFSLGMTTPVAILVSGIEEAAGPLLCGHPGMKTGCEMFIYC